MRTRFLWLLTANLACLFLTAAPAHAQRATPRAITLVEHDSLPAGTQAMVVRRKGGGERDLIVISRAATGDDLGAALAALAGLRARFGDNLQQDLRAPIRSFTPTAAWKNSRGRLAESFLYKLRRSPERNVGGFGRGRALTIKFPGSKP